MFIGLVTTGVRTPVLEVFISLCDAVGVSPVILPGLEVKQIGCQFLWTLLLSQDGCFFEAGWQGGRPAIVS